MRQTIFCKHYRALAKHDTCEVGISYAAIKPEGRGFNYPCFWNRGDGETRPAGSTCAQCTFPTDEEIAAEEAETLNRFRQIGIARKAIVDHLGGAWTKKDRKGGSGRIDCPVCHAKDALSFSRAAYNGHIHARCATTGCMHWSE